MRDAMGARKNSRGERKTAGSPPQSFTCLRSTLALARSHRPPVDGLYTRSPSYIGCMHLSHTLQIRTSDILSVLPCPALNSLTPWHCSLNISG